MRWSEARTADWLARIGHGGGLQPRLETLAALHQAHVLAVPFEHLDALRGRVPSLTLPDLQRKLVEERRGGWCFEHAAFLQAQLQALGFEVTVLPAAVLWEQPPQARPAAEHAVLQVALDGQDWLVDAGFGRLTLTAPLRLEAGPEQGTPHGRYRLLAEPDGLLRVEALLDRGWAPLYRLARRAWAAADWLGVNARLARHADSRFRQHLFLARAGAGGVRHSLRNGRYLRRDAAGHAEMRQLPDLPSLQAVMTEAFGLDLRAIDDDGTLPALLTRCLETPT
ncbi:MAG: hypothetical protein RL026_1465 [Pseudomonadota bacterium]